MKRMTMVLVLSALLPGFLDGQAAEEGAFVLVLGRDTLAVENFTRGADRVEAEMTGAAVGRMVYGGVPGPDGTLREFHLQAWAAGAAPDARPAQTARLAFSGDTAVVDISAAGQEQVQRLPSRADAVPYVNPSFLLMEQVLRRARALGGDTVAVPMFFLQGGQTIDATVTWQGRGAATIVLGGMPMHVTLSSDGRLMTARVPSQNLSVERIEGRHLPPRTLEPPDYSSPADAPYETEHVRIETPVGHVLAGTLTRPAGDAPVPAVVLVSGSGAQDRDEAIPTLPGYRPFREIADTLSRRGIAVLRFDDRGYGESGGDPTTATSADFADDVRSALAYLRNRPDIDGRRLGVAGHSEGGLIAPMVAAADASLAAIALIAGPAYTGRRIIHYQQRQAFEQAGLDEPAVDSASAEAREELERMAASQPWLGYFLGHDPLATARLVRETPVLVLQGATDRQVTPEQAEILARTFREAGNPDVTVRVFPGVNHLMLEDPEGYPAGYSGLEDRSVSRALLGALADWLAERLR